MIEALAHLRITRPVGDLARTMEMYCRGLGLRIVGEFRDHDGFDGVMLGDQALSWHLEFTHCPRHPIAPSPTAEDLLVLYLPDRSQWETTCANMLTAGFREVVSFNPYWAEHGRTFEDHDGYRIVLQNTAWSSVERS